MRHRRAGRRIARLDAVSLELRDVAALAEDGRPCRRHRGRRRTCAMRASRAARPSAVKPSVVASATAAAGQVAASDGLAAAATGVARRAWPVRRLQAARMARDAAANSRRDPSLSWIVDIFSPVTSPALGAGRSGRDHRPERSLQPRTRGKASRKREGAIFDAQFAAKVAAPPCFLRTNCNLEGRAARVAQPARQWFR